MKKLIVFTLIVLFIQMTYGHDKHPVVHDHYVFVEKGNIYDNGYPEEKFNEVLNIFKQIYGPIIHQAGGTFHIMDDWTDGAVNMWAWRIGDEYWLEIPGGMSRYHLINEEAFILTICHELGHLLGGEPTRGIGIISVEGQADYYSTSNCARKMLTAIKPYRRVSPSKEVKGLCAGEFEEFLCHRILMGSLSITSYFAFLEKNPFPLFSTPSRERVSQTLGAHPKAQCRLDTLYAGYVKRERPRCWFKS